MEAQTRLETSVSMITFKVDVRCDGCDKPCGPGLILNEDGSTSPSIADYLLQAQECGWAIQGSALWCERCTKVLPPWRTESHLQVKGGAQ